MTFCIEMGLTFLLSGVIFLVMIGLQRRRQKEAEQKFRLFLRSKGIDPDLK